jgi:hypothetical protein
VGCGPWCAELLRRDLQVRTRHKTIAAQERLSGTAHLIRSMHADRTHGSNRARSEGFFGGLLRARPQNALESECGLGLEQTLIPYFGASSLICVKTNYSRADVIADDDGCRRQLITTRRIGW